MQAESWRPAFFKKETPAQEFSRQFWVMFKNMYFAEQQQTAASDITHKRALTLITIQSNR